MRVPDETEALRHLATLHASAFVAPWTTGELAELLSQPGVFSVAEPDGFILIRQVLDEAEILTLAVRPDARRAGLGGRLLGQAVLSAARGGAVRIFLEVSETNTAARALYQRAGFEAVGRRKGYYDGGRTDALVLALHLGSAPGTPALP